MDHHLNFQMPPNGGMHHSAPPPMGHPPPQVFNTFDPAGPDAMPHLPPDYVAQMFPDSHLMFDESQDAKRRRIARACDMCRKKKIKCDGKLPACTQCINYKTDCVFTQVEKKRSPPKGAKYIQGLENRLGRMEHLLRLSGLLGEDEETDLGALEKRLEEKKSQSRQASTAGGSNPTSPRSLAASASVHDDPTSPSSVASTKDKEKEREKKEKDDKKENLAPTVEQEEEEDVEALSDMMCSLVTNQSGETRYLGSSSGFSIFSPKGIQWVNSKTGDDSFRNMISEVSEDDHKWTNWKPEVFSDVFRRPVFLPLPPKDQALSLLKDYFENFNCMFPLTLSVFK